MKIIKNFRMMAVVTLLMMVSISCKEKNEIVGTIWKGTDSEGYPCTLTFNSVTNCILSYVDYDVQFSATYTFNPPNISIKISGFSDNLSGTVIGNQMTLADGYGTIVFTKQ